MAVEQHRPGGDTNASAQSPHEPEEARSTPLVTPPPLPRREPEPRQGRERPRRESGPVERVDRVAPPAGEDERTAAGRDADVLLDIPRLEVDELALELEATTLLRHVRLEVKDLQLGLLLRADVERLADLAWARSHDAPAGRRTGGRLASATYGRLFGAERQRPQLGSGAEQPEEETERTEEQPAQAREHESGPRLGHLAKEGGKAAAVAAAGLAGGALVEARLKPLRKHGVELPSALRKHGVEIPSALRRHESAPRAALRRVARALPG
jgi:hypothetical protein